MSEIRERVIREMEWALLDCFPGGASGIYAARVDEQKLIKKILSIENLAVVDREAELPDNPYDKSLIDLPERIWRGFAFQEGISVIQKDGWVKEITD